MTEIIEGNKLIAEFMELKTYRNGTCDDPTKGVPSLSFGIKYHSSWDWLMPVVEKMDGRFSSNSRYNGLIEINTTKVSILYWQLNEKPHFYIELFTNNHKSTIEMVFKAVVEFIKWYNKNYKAS